MSDKKKIRTEFRESVFSRDNHKCVICGSTKKLDAHHITDRSEMPNGGYVLENGITLCANCHRKAEYWHETDGDYFILGLTPYDLYKKIDSNYGIAYEKAMGL